MKQFDEISKEIKEKYPKKSMVIVCEEDTNGVDKYVVAYESHKFKNRDGYYLGSIIEQVKIN